MSRLTLVINLDDDTMNKSHHVSRALDIVSYEIQHANNYDKLEPMDRYIRDEKGNIVGDYQVVL